MARELLIATHNAGKVRELRDLLAGSGWTVRGLPEGTPEFPEDGTTFAENARGKALFYAERVGIAALADDSGLEVDALDGAPGVYSARFIDPQITQMERNEGLLEMLEDVEEPRRSARFVCHLVLALPGRVIHETTGAARPARSPGRRAVPAASATTRSSGPRASIGRSPRSAARRNPHAPTGGPPCGP